MAENWVFDGGEDLGEENGEILGVLEGFEDFDGILHLGEGEGFLEEGELLMLRVN